MTSLTVHLGRAAQRLTWGYLSVAVLLLLLEWLAADAEIASIRRLTSLRRTDGLASWVISSLAVLVALAAWQTWFVTRERRRGWVFVAIVATVLAVDRGTRLTLLLSIVEHDRLGLLPEITWLLLWTLAGGIAFRFLWTTSQSSRVAQILAATSFVAAAVLQGAVGGAAAGSLSVVCTGAGLVALLVVFLRQLATQPEPSTWYETADQRLYVLRRLSTVAIAVFVALCLFDFSLEAQSGVNPVFRRYFNPASEASLSSWLATTQSFLLALTAWLGWTLARGRGCATARGWWILAACFTYLSLDDGAMVHERVATVINVTRSWIENFPSYTWQFVYLPLLAMLGAFVVLFLWTTLATRSQRVLILAGLACLVFAVGLDYVEGLQRVGESLAFRHGSKVVEETVELIGVHLIWVAVLAHDVLGRNPLRFRVVPDPN